MSFKTIAFIGGDRRITYMAPLLKDKGYDVLCYGVPIPDMDSLREAVDPADVVIGGIPFLGEEGWTLDELAGCLHSGQMIFGGMLPENFLQQCEESDVLCYDFMREESIVVYNAIATAEGAILEAMHHQETNLHQSNSLVLGYGRCGKVLSEKLKGLSSYVTVCSREKMELSWAEAYGLKTLPMEALKQEIHKYEYIFNTVPCQILKEEILRKVRKDGVIIDIASGEGGVEKEAVENLGLRSFHCLGLPGKYAGRSSARALSDYVERMTGGCGDGNLKIASVDM